MKNVWTQIALAAGALTLTMNAQAVSLRAVLDFETAVMADGFTPFAPLLGNGDEFYQPGIAGHTMFFDPFSNSALAEPGDLVGSLVSSSDPSICAGLVCPNNNASTYVAMANDGALLFGATDGYRFSVKSFKASFIGNGDPLQATPGFVRLQGVRAGVSSTQTFALTGLDAANNLNFTTFNTTGAFSNTEFDVVYAFGFACPAPGAGTSCTSFSTNRAQFGLDDIIIEHVPEPSSIALLGLAGIAAFSVRRRRAI